MVRCAAVLGSLLAVSVLCSRAQIAVPAPVPVIVDTDIGDDIDDAYALAYALRSPEYNILAVTTTFGDTPLRAHLVLHMLEDAGRADIPVAAGAAAIIPNTFSQTAYARADHHTLSSESAADLILRTVRERPGQVTLIAIGPLNNIGAAIDRDPAGFRQLKRVIVMGGSVHRGYNKSDGTPNPRPEPEWNILNNPTALRKLLASGVPVSLMPLDSTQIILPEAIKRRIVAQPDKLSQALAELTREFNKPTIVLYDPLTLATAGAPSLCPTVPMHIDVTDKGSTIAAPGTPNADVCLKANESDFIAALSRRLLHAP